MTDGVPYFLPDVLPDALGILDYQVLLLLLIVDIQAFNYFHDGHFQILRPTIELLEAAICDDDFVLVGKAVR